MLWFLLGALAGACLGVVAMGICQSNTRTGEFAEAVSRRRRLRSLRLHRHRLQSRFIA